MSRSVRVVAVMCALIVALSSAGCFNAGLIAKVNGVGIKEEEFNAEVERYRAQYPTMFQNDDGEFRFRRTLLNQMIDAELLRQAAKDKDVEVTDEEVDGQIENLKKGFQDQTAFEAALEKSGYTYEQFREFTRDQLTSQKLIAKVAEDVAVTDEEIKAEYTKNKDKYVRQPYEMVHTAHILFDAEDEKGARAAYDDIVGGADFAVVAKQFSKDARSKEAGGDLGWGTMPYPAEYQAAVDKLRVGQMSEPVKTSDGWQIIKVIERKTDKQKTLEEVTEQIRQILFQQRQATAYQEYLRTLRVDADVEIFDESLEDAFSSVDASATPSE